MNKSLAPKKSIKKTQKSKSIKKQQQRKSKPKHTSTQTTRSISTLDNHFNQQNISPITSQFATQRRFKAAAATAAVPLSLDVTPNTTSSTDAAAAAPAPVVKKEGTLKTMYKKYGRLAIMSYLGVYFGGMVAFPLAVYVAPFESQSLIDWCIENNHLVGVMDWVSQKLDEFPALGAKVRSNPKAALDAAAGLLINELVEPLRIPLAVVIMKHFGDKRQAAQDNEALVHAAFEETTTPEIKETKQQQNNV